MQCCKRVYLFQVYSILSDFFAGIGIFEKIKIPSQFQEAPKSRGIVSLTTEIHVF